MRLKQKVSGNILLFYSFDVGDDIDLNVVKNRGLVSSFKIPQSHYFKDYHVPLSFRLVESKDGKAMARQDAVLNKLHHFGALSLCYKIPFDASFEQLKQKVIEVKRDYDEKSKVDAHAVFKNILPAITKPRFYNLKNDYFAIHVNPIAEKISAEEFVEFYGSKIASLLRLETEVLSDYQQDEILSSTTGYYGQDLIIIDSEASFIYDDEFYEPMEFFESANIELLELQYFDRLLDKRLNYFYQPAGGIIPHGSPTGGFNPHKMPLRAYIPLIGRRAELPASRLVRLRVDILVVTERLKNSIKMTGDAYYSTLYSMLVDKLSLQYWRTSINKKLDIIGDLYSVHQTHLDSINEEVLTVVIIVLIALEIVLAVIGSH